MTCVVVTFRVRNRHCMAHGFFNSLCLSVFSVAKKSFDLR